MKKIILIGTAALGMFFMTTSCLENVEPAGIEAMRQAKAELISAQAAYKAAETAYLTAQQALVDVEVAKKEIENQMMEIDLQAKQLDLEMQQAQNEHDIRMLELEYLRQQAQDEARQKELESQISYWEYLIAKNQMDTELLDLDREVALEKHNARMIDLQARTAEAEYELEMALRDLEALKIGLSTEEQAQLTSLTDLVSSWQQSLETAQNTLVDADRQLIEAQYSWQADSTYYTNLYTLQVEAIQREIEVLQREQEGAAEIINSDSWAAKKVETEEEMKSIEDQITDLKMQAQAKEADKDPFNEQLNALNLRNDSLQSLITNLEGQINDAQSNSNMNERASFEIAVPEAIVPYVATDFKNTIKDNSTTSSAEDANVIVVTSDFEKDAATGEYTLPGGKFVYETSYSQSKELLTALSQKIKALTAPQIASLNSALTNATNLYNDELTGIKTLYDFYTQIYEKGLAEYNAIAGAYGITIEKTSGVTPLKLNYDNMWKDGSDAYNALLQLPADATDAQKQAQLTVIATEQMLRDSLDGGSVIPYGDITLVNYKAGTVDLSPLAYYYASDPSFTAEDIQNKINPKSTEAQINEYDALDLWNTASKQLFGVEYLTEPFTPEYIGYGVVFTFDYNGDVKDPDVNMAPIDGADYNTYLEQIQSGYSSKIDDTYLYKELSQSALIEHIQSQITNNADYSLLAETIGTELDKIDEISKSDGEDLKALYAELRSLYEQKTEVEDQIKIVKNSISNVDFEIGKICSEDLMNQEVGYYPNDNDYSQVAVLMNAYNRLQDRVNLLNILLRQEGYDYYYIYSDVNRQYTFDFTSMMCTVWNFSDGTSYNYEFTFDDFQNEYTSYYEGLINNSNEELREAQTKLDRLVNSDGEPLEQVIADLEQALADAQAEYDNTLAIFTMWSDKLNDLLALIAGNTEETPETPEA